MINNINKKLQSIFKKTGYGIFKILYGQIKDFKKAGSDKNSFVELSKVDDSFNYKIYYNYHARIYTDTVSDTAIIQDNKIIEGPSFQIRDVKFEDIKKNIVFNKGTPRLKKKLNNRLFSLLTGGAGNHNYWHWMFDVLPRIKILSKKITFDEKDFFLFPNLEKKFQQETIDFFKIPNSKRLSSLKNRHLSCEEIICTDHPYVIKNNATDEIQNVPMWIIRWLQETFLKETEINQNEDLPKKIYIDRSDATSNLSMMRKIINDNEIKSQLDKIGFKIIKLSNLSFVKQVKIFQNADIIIGLHGGGFTNLVFCKPGTKIIELKPSGAGMMYENLAKKCSLNYYSIAKVPEKFNQNNQHGYISVDFKEILNYL